MNEKVRDADKTAQEIKHAFHEQLQRIIAGDESARDGLQTLAEAVKRSDHDFMEVAKLYIRKGSRIN